MYKRQPLGILKEGGGELPSYLDLFLGNTGGCLGETCALAILLEMCIRDRCTSISSAFS